MFIFDESYDRDNSLPPQDIREDFSGLTFEHGMNPQVLLDQLASFLPASVLAEFMDDLANGRVWVVTATFRITTSYGMIRCYPVNATAKLLCDLSGFKTLTTDSLSIIEDLGYTCLNTINDSLITHNSLI